MYGQNDSHSQCRHILCLCASHSLHWHSLSFFSLISQKFCAQNRCLFVCYLALNFFNACALCVKSHSRVKSKLLHILLWALKNVFNGFLVSIYWFSLVALIPRLSYYSSLPLFTLPLSQPLIASNERAVCEPRIFLLFFWTLSPELFCFWRSTKQKFE